MEIRNVTDEYQKELSQVRKRLANIRAINKL